MPMELLKNYLISAQLSFIEWWVRSEAGYSPQQVAMALHQLQRSILRDVYQLAKDGDHGE